MPRAGFFAIHNTAIRFGRDGHWYADGEQITNPRIVKLFSRNVVRQEDGSYRIQIGWDKAPIEVDDTPYVVRRIDADGDGNLIVELNDESREPLAGSSLEISAENVVYCRVKGASERARLLRAACHQLAPYIHEKQGHYVVRIGAAEYPIADVR